MRHSHSDSDKSQIFGVAAIAAGIGALTALLFSPRNGAETRRAVREKAEQMKGKAKNPIQDISEAADNAEAVVAKAKTRVKKTVDDKISDK